MVMWDFRMTQSACVCKQLCLWEMGKETMHVTSQEEGQGEKGQNCPTLPAFAQDSARFDY